MFPQERQDEFDNAKDYCEGFQDPAMRALLADNDLEKLRLWREFCQRQNWEPTVRYVFGHTCVPIKRAKTGEPYRRSDFNNPVLMRTYGKDIKEQGVNDQINTFMRLRR